MYSSQRITTLIWNPCIRKFLFLPLPRVTLFRHKIFAFGYDSRTDHYKVLRIVKPVCYEHEVEIWSLARGSWKILSVVVLVFLQTSCLEGLPMIIDNAFVNGALHWIRQSVIHEDDKLIVSFDLSAELFGKILLLKAALQRRRRRGVGTDFCFVSRHGESLAFFEQHEKRRSDGSVYISFFHLWMMKEYGVAESWAKLFTIRGMLLGDQKFHGWVDPNTKKCSDFGIDGHSSEYRFMDSFVESLILLDNPNAISY
ncbi:hypothetical protein L3X38_035093 [Prunus dulcis]|uniref:F-box associated beta-propeller type 1 domain-containing protein n=1 Tax=Prunus dulcis TaxID=3755 RepID=A0AAD4YYH3_PRUDU|nr:hypothetical protein L3X38_035093 [Prunus dulcis]